MTLFPRSKVKESGNVLSGIHMASTPFSYLCFYIRLRYQWLGVPLLFFHSFTEKIKGVNLSLYIARIEWIDLMLIQSFLHFNVTIPLWSQCNDHSICAFKVWTGREGWREVTSCEGYMKLWELEGKIKDDNVIIISFLWMREKMEKTNLLFQINYVGGL